MSGTTNHTQTGMYTCAYLYTLSLACLPFILNHKPADRCHNFSPRGKYLPKIVVLWTSPSLLILQKSATRTLLIHHTLLGYFCNHSPTLARDIDTSINFRRFLVCFLICASTKYTWNISNSIVVAYLSIGNSY